MPLTSSRTSHFFGCNMDIIQPGLTTSQGFLCQIMNMKTIFSTIKALHKYSAIINYEKKSHGD